MSLEDDLRKALRRKAPPEGFAERVVARVVLPPAAGSLARRRQGRSPLVRALAVAAALVITAAAASYYRHQVVQLDGERAARELRIALQIASEKLALVERRVNRDDDTKASTREVPR
ncbi:MAG TPA: hypothetical protein VFV95_05585 [Vicinamibacterales bacterium]|nr:hypothetical protein [Vicinamibacterales bacterium]